MTRGFAARFSAALLVAALFPPLCAAVSPAPAGGGDKTAAPLSVGYEERSRIDVVEAWPFVVVPKLPQFAEVCRQLGTEGLQVRENGTVMRVLSVVQAPPVATHALVIDSSSSMMSPFYAHTRRKGRQTKVAAKAYVHWMLDDAKRPRGRPEPSGALGSDPVEELIVTTFDDDLVLRAGPVRVDAQLSAARIAEQIDAITGGYFTTLNDSVFRIVHFLGGRGDRSSIVLLSDGADRNSIRGAAALEELARRTNNVTVFAIGIDLPDGPHQRFLQRIAEATGGVYYPIPGRRADRLAGLLRKRFEKIRRRLARQLYVSYLTVPAGDMEQDADETEDAAAGFREVRIITLDDRCHIPQHGYRRRRSLLQPADDTALIVAASDGQRTTPGDLRFRLQELTRDDDPLVKLGAGTVPRRAVLRTVTLSVPPFERALDPAIETLPRTPEGIVLGRLLDGSVPDRTAGQPRRLLEREINGKTFLDRRGALARLIFEQFEPYREWALAKVEARLRSRLAAQFPRPASAEERARHETVMETVVRHRLEQTAPEQYRDLLAAWRGDVSARDLAFGIERDLADAILAGRGLSRADRAQRRWSRLHDWFFFPDRIRVVTPLDLTCDPEEEVCGFFRIVLPRPGDLPEDPHSPASKTLAPTSFEEYRTYATAKVPRHPFGLMLVRWLAGRAPHPGGEPGESLDLDTVRSWRIADVSHEPLPIPQEKPAKRSDEPPPPPTSCRRSVRVDLQREGTERAGATLQLIVDGHVTPGANRVADACEESDAPPRLEPLCYLEQEPALPDAWLAVLRRRGLEPCAVPIRPARRADPSAESLTTPRA